MPDGARRFTTVVEKSTTFSRQSVFIGECREAAIRAAAGLPRRQIRFEWLFDDDGSSDLIGGGRRMHAHRIGVLP
jgi:hypothetical protein